MCKDCDNETLPCCNNGLCEHDKNDKSGISMCICCGAEMFEEKGSWFHYSQKDIPFGERKPQA